GDQRGPQHLDSHLAPVPEVVGQVDRRHAAGADFPLQLVAAGEGGFQALEGVVGFVQGVPGVLVTILPGLAVRLVPGHLLRLQCPSSNSDSNPASRAAIPSNASWDRAAWPWSFSPGTFATIVKSP